MEDHNPIHCIQEMTRLALAGEVLSFEFWDHETHVQRWALDTWKDIRDGHEPIFGNYTDESELALAINECANALGVVQMDCGLDSPLTAANAGARGAALSVLLQIAMILLQNPELIEVIRKLIDGMKLDG